MRFRTFLHGGIAPAAVLVLLGLSHSRVSASDADNLVTEEPTPADAESPPEESPVLVVPSSMGYQGFLTDNSGVPINGGVVLSLRIWDSAVGGASLWSEVQSPVLVQDGVFSIGLGDVNPLPVAIFDGTTPLWLGIGVDGEVELPRTQLRTSPFAFNAERLDGLSSSDYIQKAGDSMIGVLGLDGGVTGLTAGGVTEVVSSTSDVTLRHFFFEQQVGQTGTWTGRDGRVIISTGGGGTPSGGGSGVATVYHNGGLVSTIAIPSGGGRPWTYVVEIASLGNGATVDVRMRAISAASPVFVRSIILETDNAGGGGGGNSLDEAYDEGGAGAGRTITANAGAVNIQGPDGLDVLGPVNLGDAGTNGYLSVAADGYATGLGVYASGFGAQMVVRDGGGSPTCIMQPDFNAGGGSYFQLFRTNTADVGLTFDGNLAGTNEPLLRIDGSTRDAVFDMSIGGNASVILPDDAIGDTEIIDEPGVSQGKVNGLVDVTGETAAMIDIVTTTITIPTSGYIVLTASGQAAFSGSTTGNYMAIQIDETAGGSRDVNHYYFAGWTSDSFSSARYDPVQTQRTYFKAAGTYTFRLEAQDWNGAGTKYLWNPVITASFLPTGYGSVQERPPGPELAQFTDVTYRETGTNGPGTVSESAPMVDLRELEIRLQEVEAENARLREELLQSQMQAQTVGVGG